MKKDHLATVNAERVAARVGSKFSDMRDVIQVRLQKGETVEILDRVTTTEPQGEKTVWCKISPPSGEFPLGVRQIRGSRVSARRGAPRDPPGSSRSAPRPSQRRPPYRHRPSSLAPYEPNLAPLRLRSQ